MNFRRIALFFTLSAVVALLMGCGPRRPSDLPRLYPCHLTVLLEDGTPVEDAVVTLVNVISEENSRWFSSGRTDSNGHVTIRTVGEFSGAPAGTYRVSVSKLGYTATGRFFDSGEEMYDAFQILDPIFTNTETTPLTIEIKDRAVRETLRVRPAPNERRQ